MKEATHAGEGIRWPYVAYTTVMFSFVTIYTAMGLDVQSISFIDNRNVPLIDGSLTSGPIGYQSLIESEAIHVVPDIIFLLNDLLSDGLLVSSAWDREAGRLLRFSDKLARRVFPIFFSITLIFFVHTSLDVQFPNHSTDSLDFYGVGIVPSRAFY